MLNQFDIDKSYFKSSFDRVNMRLTRQNLQAWKFAERDARRAIQNYVYICHSLEAMLQMEMGNDQVATRIFKEAQTVKPLPIVYGNEMLQNMIKDIIKEEGIQMMIKDGVKSDFAPQVNGHSTPSSSKSDMKSSIQKTLSKAAVANMNDSSDSEDDGSENVPGLFQDFSMQNHDDDEETEDVSKQQQSRSMESNWRVAGKKSKTTNGYGLEDFRDRTSSSASSRVPRETSTPLAVGSKPSYSKAISVENDKSVTKEYSVASSVSSKSDRDEKVPVPRNYYKYTAIRFENVHSESQLSDWTTKVNHICRELGLKKPIKEKYHMATSNGYLTFDDWQTPGKIIRELFVKHNKKGENNVIARFALGVNQDKFHKTLMEKEAGVNWITGHECRHWRTTGCVYPAQCEFEHIDVARSIDRQAWMKDPIAEGPSRLPNQISF